MIENSLRYIFFGCSAAIDLIHKMWTWWDINFPVLISFDDWLSWFRGVHMQASYQIYVVLFYSSRLKR